MDSGDAVRDWWTSALLGEPAEPYPRSGRYLGVEMDGDTVTLTGEVRTHEELQQLEQEALAIDVVQRVVNKLTVAGHHAGYRLQTVVAQYADRRTAELAGQAMPAWTHHTDSPAILLENREKAEPVLRELASAAHLPDAGLAPFFSALDQGKVLVLDRVSEGDALLIISALEGTRAESIRTFPPEDTEPGK
ncbi:MAG: BON domain-containing protein [Chloroflexota bacterium]